MMNIDIPSKPTVLDKRMYDPWMRSDFRVPASRCTRSRADSSIIYRRDAICMQVKQMGLKDFLKNHKSKDDDDDFDRDENQSEGIAADTYRAFKFLKKDKKQ